MFERILLVVLDGFGIGSYKKNESFNSLGHAIERYGEHVNKDFATLNSWGLQLLLNNSVEKHILCGCYGRTRQQSIFCDSFAAHWEMAGRVVNSGFAFTNGVPEKYFLKVKKEMELSFVGNEICYEDISMLDPRLIKLHREMKKPILLTIPKYEPISTIGIMSFENVIEFEKLSEYGFNMAKVLKGEKGIGRIVVKTLIEKDGKITEGKRRRDFSLFSPPKDNLLSSLQDAGIKTYATGKINSLFNGEGIMEGKTSWDNKTIFNDTVNYFNSLDKGLVWANFNSLDRPYGHKGDVDMWIKMLTIYDGFLSKFKELISEKDLLILTGDHGCDPTGRGNHTREWNPLFVYNPKILSKNLGDHFHGDIGKTISDNFGIGLKCRAKSFFDQIQLVY